MANALVFLGTGGTIAGKAASAQDNVGYTAGQVGVAQLLQGIPGLADSLGGLALEHEQVAQVDSKDMAHGVWAALAQRVVVHLGRDAVQGVVITHGTDTLEETAYFLSRVLPAELLARKPVVLTCAMRPSTALAPDGPQNVLDAVQVAQNSSARGVLAVCAGMVHAALHVQKIHPYRLNAFDSGEAGVLAYVEEGRVRWVQECPRVGSEVPWSAPRDAALWPRVEVVFSHAGAGGTLVHALCAPLPDGSPPLRGIVVAGTGNGTVHHDMESALVDAQNQGVQVVRTTRCAYGAVVAGSPSPFPLISDLPPFKARVALMLQLMRG